MFTSGRKLSDISFNLKFCESIIDFLAAHGFCSALKHGTHQSRHGSLIFAGIVVAITELRSDHNGFTARLFR